MQITENLERIKNQISEASKGRNVKLLAVSKFHPVEKIEEAYMAGQRDFGENRVLEAYEKFTFLKSKYPDINLHIIGHLQTNKVSKAVQVCDCIESVDSLKLVREIEKHAGKIGKKISVLFEYHTGEESKTGFLSEEEVFEALDYIKSECKYVVPCGFMTMAPISDDDSLIRSSFKKLVFLQKKCIEKYPDFDLSELSMGMSGDFEAAIEEGSTMVRIGTAIFGEREY